MLVVLPAGRQAMAADGAAALIEAASRAVGDAVTWEASGRLVTQESADDAAPRSEASFRVVMERVPTQRARIEITDVPDPLVRVCDGSVQWGYLPAAKQYWSLNYTRIDVCAGPFDEWPYLAADLHELVLTGQEQLHIGEKVVDCTVVRGDYAGPSVSRSGKRTLWIEDRTNTIWRYRVERGATGLASPAEPAVRVYTLLHQTSNGVRQPGDFALQDHDEWVMLLSVPFLRLGDGAPLQSKDHAEPGSELHRARNGAAAPVLVRKVQPQYTAAARDAHLEGTVVLSAEVWPDGAVHNIRVFRSLDPGLDQEAIQAASRWKFRPGTKDGVPVRIAVTLMINFRLLDGPNKK